MHKFENEIRTLNNSNLIAIICILIGIGVSFLLCFSQLFDSMISALIGFTVLSTLLILVIVVLFC